MYFTDACIMRVLNVAEKQSVARELAAKLGRGSATSRRVSGQAVSDFSLDSHSMTVTAVRGHLMELEFENPALRNWNQTDPSVLFSERIKQSVNNREIASCLASLARQTDALVLWLDCDREGEAIAFEVVEVCQKANPRLQIHPNGPFVTGRIFRARFSALTQADLLAAWQALGAPPNAWLAQAVLARSEIDLRIGAAFTRFLTLRSSSSRNNLISFGPCQFPTLGFVVDRHLQISRFVPEQFWALKLVVGGPLQMLWNRGRLFDLAAVEALKHFCRGVHCLVTEFVQQPKLHRRPLPLNTLELTKLASTHLRLASHECMKIAETLYHKGIVSYPRTETDKFHESMDIAALVQIHSSHSIWGPYVSRLVYTVPRQGSRDDQAHPPIHPLQAVEESMFDNSKEWALYELITRHFLACCSPDAKGSNTHMEVILGIEKFHADGLVVLEKNWLDIYPYARWGSAAGTSQIPQSQIGQRLPVQSLSIESGQTEPPTLLSEAELIDLMDQNGIGTDATMHDHIKTIQDRKYCFKNAQAKFVPNPIGVGLVLGISVYCHLARPTLRAAMEADMARIAAGTYTRAEFLAKYIAQAREIFHALADNPYYLDQQIASASASVAPRRARGARAPRSRLARPKRRN